MAVGTKPNREVSIGLVRNGAGRRYSHADAACPVKAASKWATSACCRTCTRRLRTVTAGEPGDQAGLKVGDVIVAVDGHPMTFHWQFRDANRQASRGRRCAFRSCTAA